jgi:mono/diheme cytochrome c family protein
VRRFTLLAASLLAACSAPGDLASPSTADAEGALFALPAQAPERFSFGFEASEERIGLWDIDVKPDGEGLPPGSGTVAEGEVVYGTYCSGCHGLTGVEGPYDILVGTNPWDEWPGSRTVGGYWPYATTLYDYIRRAMPQLTPGVLTADETYGVIAYLLYMNDLVPEDAVMNAETLPDVEMPARDRFVIDDRRGGSEVR